MTGLATGPHLHYEYLLRGVHKDPQRVALPNDVPIPAQRLGEFRAQATPLLASLEAKSPAPLLAARVRQEPSGASRDSLSRSTAAR